MSKVKYLWAAALVALCASLMSGAALAADGWTVTDQDLPAAIEWDIQVPASVDAFNSGDTTWDSTYCLVAVEGATLAATEVARWCLTCVPVTTTTVVPSGSYAFDFTVTGPPITTMLYGMPLTVSGVATADGLECSWQMAHPCTPTATLITTDIARQTTVVGRFPDDQPGTLGAWARFWIQELAGRVPLVVSGYPPATPTAPPTYRPDVVVDRAQMAVYMTRALYLPTQAYQGTFSVDVPSSHWAWPWIEALADAGIVAGYGPGVYQPEWTLTRDQMAAFVAYGMEGQRVVPSGPAVGTFDDVPDADPGPAHWAYDEIEYCVANGIVSGYTPTIYQPGWDVTRDQMAVFVYRGFMQSTGCAVVLGGPEITALDPSTVTYYGWCSATSGAAADPGYAYVIFDGARLDYNLAYPQTPTATWDVTFELRGPHAPTPTLTISWDTTTDIQDAYDAVTTNNGVPYTVMSWDIPGGLTAGDYTLVVLVEDPQGNMNEVARQPAFTITP